MPGRPTICSDVMGAGADAEADGAIMTLSVGVGTLPTVVVETLPAVVAMPPPSNTIDMSGGGLMPGVASSVAPMGRPVGETGEPGPSPKGDVTPSGEARLGSLLCPATCAMADPQLRMTDRTIGRTYRFMATGPPAGAGSYLPAAACITT
jgi:hypothetical protein